MDEKKKASSKKRERVINSKKSSMERTVRVDHHVQTSFIKKIEFKKK